MKGNASQRDLTVLPCFKQALLLSELLHTCQAHSDNRLARRKIKRAQDFKEQVMAKEMANKLKQSADLIKAGQHDHSIEVGKDALLLDPENANAHYLIGLALLQKGDPRAALEYLLVSVQRDPRSSLYHHHTGILPSPENLIFHNDVSQGSMIW